MNVGVGNMLPEDAGNEPDPFVERLTDPHCGVDEETETVVLALQVESQVPQSEPALDIGPLTLSLVPSFWLQVHIRVTLPSCLRSCYRLHLTGRIVSWRGEDGLQDTNFLSNATGNEGSKEAVLSCARA